MNNAPMNYDCPPLMSDGRHGTDYRPDCVRHVCLNKRQGFTHSNQQRLFLQRNAEQLRAENLQQFLAHANCASCTDFHVDPNGHDQYWAEYRKSLKM